MTAMIYARRAAGRAGWRIHDPRKKSRPPRLAYAAVAGRCTGPIHHASQAGLSPRGWTGRGDFRIRRHTRQCSTRRPMPSRIHQGATGSARKSIGAHKKCKAGACAFHGVIGRGALRPRRPVSHSRKGPIGAHRTPDNTRPSFECVLQPSRSTFSRIPAGAGPPRRPCPRTHAAHPSPYEKGSAKAPSIDAAPSRRIFPPLRGSR